VICGGGALGAAVAYKLAQRGLGSDTVIIDKGEMGGGTTAKSSGLVGMLKTSSVETKLSKISKALYLELEEKGYYTGWKQNGSVHVAQTKERMHYFRRWVEDKKCFQR
jgi:glycine/D-amino acid oxidase-like deaminating enzyme